MAFKALDKKIWQRLEESYRLAEDDAITGLLSNSLLDEHQREKVYKSAENIVKSLRKSNKKPAALIDAFMQKYDLSSNEGLLLMCLAEALLRIPDRATMNQLIQDKLRQGDFKKHKGGSASNLVNLSTQALTVLQNLIDAAKEPQSWGDKAKALIAKTSQPVVHLATMQSIKLLANKFVVGETIQESLKQVQKDKLFYYSFDMLGEAALTAQDVDRYFAAYFGAIEAVSLSSTFRSNPDSISLSIKLSALHPRYEVPKSERVLKELTNTVIELARAARTANVSVTLDAEEADRLTLSLEIFEKVVRHPSFKGWDGIGLAVQAYQKRAPFVIDWLAELSHETKQRFPVRLVKGAYWDSEIKWCQERGLKDYPVYTRKSSTDLSYMVCAGKLLNNTKAFYPQFATHNALTVASVLELGAGKHYEFQRLYGMGEALYRQVMEDHQNLKCRIYGPVGSYKELLPYLVRRLLENGANSSFVNNIVNPAIPLERLLEDPIKKTQNLQSIRHPSISLPKDIYGTQRQNSMGVDLSSSSDVAPILKEIDRTPTWNAVSLINGVPSKEDAQIIRIVTAPQDHSLRLGKVMDADAQDVQAALRIAEAAWNRWEKTPVKERAEALLKFADLCEKNKEVFISLCVKEAGKTIADGVAEIREAVDFCRYYAHEAIKSLEQPQIFSGPTGEENSLKLRGRGVFVCISPWNFPLAIFTGQVAAALVTGNTVIAKPAEQTPMISYMAVKLLHEAGIPKDVLHLLLGDGRVGAALVSDPRVAGVVFTGSVETAWRINQTLAEKKGPIVPLIAETGGQNVMIADSSALPEQVVKDALSSAFQSAGQRCSALRILLLQEEIAPHVIALLKGAMDELTVGDPGQLSTDIGPVIDNEALSNLLEHVKLLEQKATLISQVPMDPALKKKGTFIAPVAYEIPSLSLLTREVFGPILHVLRYKNKDLPALIESINRMGFGLTGGLHTRLESRIETVSRDLAVGNLYINRNIIGAVVGVQPFGGRGLSGTGPKAGGPYYLHRFMTEQAVSNNITAQGGNTTLMCLSEED